MVTATRLALLLILFTIFIGGAECQGQRKKGRVAHKSKKKKTNTPSRPRNKKLAEDFYKFQASSVYINSTTELIRDDTEPIKITTFHSDNLFLDVQMSKLPGDVGEGVFAKSVIPPGEILCEMRGAVMSENDPVKVVTDKNVKINGTEFYVIGDGLCSKINDCVAILGKYFSEGDVERIMIADSDDVMPLHENCVYNAKLHTTAMGKIFATSTKHITPGEEIFVAYGK